MSRALPVCVLILVAAGIARAAQTPVAAVPAQPPTYWCPMHPDERAASAVACPICKMTMVPIPPMRVGEYRMDVAPIAAAGGRGLAGVRITLRDPERNAVVTALETVHEKPLHIFIVGQDLQFFRHVHPESVTGGTVLLRSSIPPGEYIVVADFLPSGGTPQLIHRAITSPGPRPAGANGEATAGRSQAPDAGDVRVQAMSTGLVAGQETSVRVVLTGAADGRPILDLEPYLGTAAHLLLVSEDLTEVVHGHAAEWTGREPVLTFEITLPRVATYRGWLQFQRRGVVVTAPIGFTAR